MASVTLSQRIEMERGERAPSEVKELDLSESKSTKIEGLSDEYINLEVLTMMNVGLEDLSGLPKLPSLKMLELSNNNISGGLDALLNCPNLEQVNFTSNKIASVDVLVPLAKLSSLCNLDLLDCKVADTENYRKAVFAVLPNLKYLDGIDENGECEPDASLLNGDDDANGEEHAEDDDDTEDEEDEEEYGIEALQRSGELEDDDEDYAPGDEEDADLNEYDEDEDDEEEDDDEVEDDGANLSGAGVSGPRRPGSKRAHSGAKDDGAPAVKQKATEESGSHVNNGASVE